MDKFNSKTILLSAAGAVLSLLGSAALGWVASQASVTSAMREGLAADRVAIDSLRKDQDRLHDSDRDFVTTGQFDLFRDEYQTHWKEQHDFQVRVDQEMMEIMTQHSKMLGGLSQQKPADLRSSK